MAIVKLHIVDNITVQILSGVNSVKKILSYPYKYRIKKRWGSEEKEGRKYVVYGNKDFRYFYAGLLPRVLVYLKKNKIEYKLTGERESFPSTEQPNLDDITFRKDQHTLIRLFLSSPTGVLVSPTGTGKTILAMGIVSAYTKAKVLMLCPRLTLVAQAVSDFKEKGFKNITTVGGGDKNFDGRIVVSTIQSYVQMYKEIERIKKKPLRFFQESLKSIPLFATTAELILKIIQIALHDTPECYAFSKLKEEELSEINSSFDIVIIDEIHLASGIEGTLSKILSRLPSPVRLGLTATLPKELNKQLTIEGLIGPVIGTLERKEAMDLGILAKPKIKLIPVPVSKGISKLTAYRDIYSAGIVHNQLRNKLIAMEAEKLVVAGKSVIIFVLEIEHIKNVSRAMDDIELFHQIVKGDTSKEDREIFRKQMEVGKIQCILSSVVWREGVNIRSLGGAILGGGGKSELARIQEIGRAARKIEGKEKATIVYFLDPYRYLAEHCIQVLSMFVREGWIKP